jgi:acetate kinase
MHILTINSGSSSVKFGLFNMGPEEWRILSGSLDRIGLRGGTFTAQGADGRILVKEHGEFPGHEAALNRLLGWLEEHPTGGGLDAVGHRVVHGGRRYTHPQRITRELAVELTALIPLAPDHLPHELQAIRAVRRKYPDRPQIACFDTAFHRGMPPVAQLYALPERFRRDGLIRYGFHGLSYEYILEELRKEAGAAAAGGRVIIAHLGNGASMAAVRGGRCVDTTMGFTPAGGLVMSTRCGDLDPGVLIYLMEKKRLIPSTLNDLVNRRSGLLGVSGISPDMKDLLEKEAAEPRAAEAVELFCYQAAKNLGALAAALGGIDTLVFTAGIGEHSPAVRERICRQLGFLGIRLDGKQNAAGAAVISADGASVTVRVMRTDEDLMIARHTWALISESQPADAVPAGTE